MSVLLQEPEIEKSTSPLPDFKHHSRSRQPYVIYCLAIALVPVIAAIAALLIARSSWYIRHQNNSYIAISDYAFTLRDYNCDVVIFGDSSAMTGISPAVIEAVTSLRTCNIAQPIPVLAITGNLALDTYLKNNTRPRFLVFQFTPPNFSSKGPNGTLDGEGALQLVRHKLDLQTCLLFTRHVVQALDFSEFILRTALLGRDRAKGTYDRSWAEIRATHGLFTAPGPPLENCGASLEMREPNPAWVRQLRSEYSQQGTHVLIYAAPLPACDITYDYYSKALAQYTDDRLQLFSIHMFNEANHFTREGAELNSKHIARDIVRALRE